MLFHRLDFNHPIEHLIRSRSSIRRYDGEPLAGEARREMESCCRTLKQGPLGTPCRFELVDKEIPEGQKGVRVGTYGTIWGARTYLVGAARDGRYALEDFGYLFELLVLKATDCNLGTCWLGGFFTRGGFEEAIDLNEGEILPAICPVGVPTRRRSLYDHIIRLGAGSKRRKPWNELTFDTASGQPLTEETAEELAPALELVRLAPSASNRQPWRMLRQSHAPGAGPVFHFYLHRFPGYRSINQTDLQRIDMGIAMVHFDLGLKAAGIKGFWKGVDPPQPPESWQAVEYVISWLPGR